MKPADPSASLRIVVVACGPAASDADLAAQARRGSTLRAGLLESGYDIVAALPADVFLAERIAPLRPDLIVVDSASDAHVMLEHIVTATRDAPRPIVLLTDDDSPAAMEAAVAAGVSAYIVADLRADRLRTALDVAMVRFRRERQLLDELADTRRQLVERKLIERAKGLLMARRKLSEEQAYGRLRSMAMSKNLKLAEIARRVLDVEDLLG